MFRRFAALQWVWFWFVSSVVFFIIDRLLPDYGLGATATTLGNYFWAGLIVVLFTWIIKLIINRVKVSKLIKG